MEGVECETDGGQKEPMEPRPSTLAGTRPSEIGRASCRDLVLG